MSDKPPLAIIKVNDVFDKLENSIAKFEMQVEHQKGVLQWNTEAKQLRREKPILIQREKDLMIEAGKPLRGVCPKCNAVSYFETRPEKPDCPCMHPQPGKYYYICDLGHGFYEALTKWPDRYCPSCQILRTKLSKREEEYLKKQRLESREELFTQSQIIELKKKVKEKEKQDRINELAEAILLAEKKRSEK